MKATLRYVLVISAALLLLADWGTVAGQSRRRRPDTQTTRSRPSSDTTTSGWATRRGSTSRTTSVIPTGSATTTSTGGSRSRTPGTSTGSDDGGGSSSYRGRSLSSFYRNQYGVWPGYRYDPLALYYCDLFYSRLLFHYGYLSSLDYVGIFAQGLPPLTSDALRLALQGSTLAARRMVALADDLELLLNGYERGEISSDEFEVAFAEKLTAIRDQAKLIRQDAYLEYLDQNKDRKDSDSYSKAGSIAALRVLVSELQQKARDMEQSLNDLREESPAQAVSVETLSRPSLASVSKDIDRLAKTIGRSVKRL